MPPSPSLPLLLGARAFLQFPVGFGFGGGVQGQAAFLRQKDGRTETTARALSASPSSRETLSAWFFVRKCASLSFLLPLPSHVLYDFAEVAAAAHSSVRREESAEEAAAVHSEEAVKMDMVPAAMARCWKRRAKEGK